MTADDIVDDIYSNNFRIFLTNTVVRLGSIPIHPRRLRMIGLRALALRQFSRVTDKMTIRLMLATMAIANGDIGLGSFLCRTNDEEIVEIIAERRKERSSMP